jgi:outer membrane protein
MNVHVCVRGCGLLLTALWLVPAARAIDLVGAWQAAQEHDLEYAAARASHDAGEARRAQSAALWRPSVDLTGTAGRMGSSTGVNGAQFSAPGLGQTKGVDFDTSVNDGNATSWAVTARQPLVSGARRAQSRELELSAELAEVQWQASRQSLMLRMAERYFEVVVADGSVHVLREQQDALERALAEAQERFRVGDSPVTDIHEAQARAQAARAQVLAAETDLQVKQFALSDVTGIPATDLHLKTPAEGQDARALAPLERWLRDSSLNNPALRIQAVGVELARQGVARSRALAGPSLDLVAKVGRDRLWGSGDFGPASNTASNGMIGIQLTVPVFTGGYRSAQHDEAVSLAEKARLDEARGRQEVALRTRASWMGLMAGADRVSALAAAREASLARLDSTRLGHHVGDRSTLDLLNAQTDAAAAELALLQARIDLLIGRLRLAALGGVLDEEELRAVSAGISRIAPEVRP